MKRSFVLFILITSSFLLYADEAMQTDWSGGSGVLGPVTDWGNTFYADTDINCYELPGQFCLMTEVIEHTVEDYFNNAFFVCSADMDSDFDIDILGFSETEGAFWWQNINGIGTQWIIHVIFNNNVDDNYVISVYPADIDGDGDNDVFAGALINGMTPSYYFCWFENFDGSGTDWHEHIIEQQIVITPDFVYSTDIDDDGDNDALLSSYVSGSILWWENEDGSGSSWIQHVIDGNVENPKCVYSADVDGDSDKDVIGAVWVGDAISWWENENGIGTSWIEHTIDDTFDGANWVYPDDIDGDDDMDVIGAAVYDDEITWWENFDGSGTVWVEHVVDDNFDAANSVCSSDLDGDGDMDILGAAVYADEITWWENENGIGTSWIKHTIDNDYDGAHSVCSDDVNGDGENDVIGAAFVDSDVTWWDLNGYFVGSLESSILDTETDPDWQTIDWTCSIPAQTSVSFQVRASDNIDNMGDWSETLTAPCNLENILIDGDSYVQYKALLNTSNPDTTPVLYDVTITWEPPGIIGESDPIITEFILYGAFPNPVTGTTVLRFAVPEHSLVNLQVYDLSGRLIDSFSDNYSIGSHQVEFSDLSSGMYIVRMNSGEFTETRRFVVIE